MPRKSSKDTDAPPLKQPPILYDRTQKYLKQIQARLDGKLVTYWNSSRGSVCHNDVIGFYQLLEELGHQEVIYLMIKSDGGNGRASLRIVNLMRRYCNKLVALVPLECASAATMIAIGADEIHMGPMAYLTAVDTSLTHDLSPVDRDNDRVAVSLDEVKRVISLWKKNSSEGKDMNPYHALFQYVHPLVIGAVDRADSLSLMLCQHILGHHLKDEKLIERISTTLNSKYPSHGYPILIEEARQVGLKVVEMDPEINSLLLELSHAYSEMGQRATTDISDTQSHSNEIANIMEREGVLIYFQHDKDWYYRTEERRWIVMNDYSSWRRVGRVGKELKHEILHFA
jgi:hypothetical protein